MEHKNVILRITYYALYGFGLNAYIMPWCLQCHSLWSALRSVRIGGTGAEPAGLALPYVLNRYIDRRPGDLYVDRTKGVPDRRQRSVTMSRTNRALQVTEEIIRKELPGHLGEGFHISHIESTFIRRKKRDVNYMTVYLEPGHPPLDNAAIMEFDIGLHERLLGQQIFDIPAVAYIDREDEGA